MCSNTHSGVADPGKDESMKRREERQCVFELLFEADFKKNENPVEIWELALENRELDLAEDSYIKTTFFGVLDNIEDIDRTIAEHAKGWKTERLSGVTRSILRLAIYEMTYAKLAPTVAINEAVELCKTFDEDKARAFANGVLNAVKVSLSHKEGESNDEA